MILIRQRAFAIVSCLCVTPAVTSGPAGAQNAPAPREQSFASGAASNSISVVRSGNYYEDHASVSCEKLYVNCFVNFAQTPSDKFLTLTNVACFTQSTNAPAQFWLSFSSATGSSPARQLFLPIAPAAYVRMTFGSDYVYTLSFNIPVNFRMGISKLPYMNFFQLGSTTTTTFNMNCTITGELTDPVY